MINGHTGLIAHIGYPTHAFKAPMIYNPWFEKSGINAVVVPMACQAKDYPDFLRSVFRLGNIRGALITMPHKVSTTALVDEVLPAAAIAGACNAVRLGPDGQLQGDMFDGAGFVRGVQRKGLQLAGARVLVVGSGGVGSAIAASLAAAGVGAMGLYDVHPVSAEALGARLQKHYPALQVGTGSKDPDGYDLVVNATPLGMNDSDPLPVDVARMASSTFAGEVVMKKEFEQIPAYLEFFGFGTATPEQLRSVARLSY
jgi:shikimate dehydrogenase